mgnify:CR=1 FL=1
MELNEFLLKTAFACMSCDGEIAKEELDLIRSMSKVNNLFGNIDIDKCLGVLVEEINQKGKGFLKQYLHSLTQLSLSEDDEIKIANVAVQMILEDKKIEYSEIKFFKVIRANLTHVTDDVLLDRIEGVDDMFLAQDIKSSYEYIYDDYFCSVELTNLKLPEKLGD